MIIPCPECGSKFRIGAGVLGDGRKVRCSSCRHTWFQEPLEALLEEGEQLAQPAAEEAAAPQWQEEGLEEAASDFPDFADPPPLGDDFVEPDTTAFRRPRGFASEPPKKKSTGLLLGWLLLLLVIGGVGYGFWYERKLVVNTIPQALKLYDLAGLQVFAPGEGLNFDNLKSERAQKDGQKLIVISGEIVNQTEEVIIVPRIQAMLVDEAGRPLTRKTVRPPAGFLGPEESMTFSVELKSAPKATSYHARFASEEMALKEPDFDPQEE